MAIVTPVIFNRENLCKYWLNRCERPGTAKGDAEVTQRERESVITCPKQLLPQGQNAGKKLGCWNLEA